MHYLNRAITQIEQGKAHGEINRKQAIACLEAVIASCAEASKVWQGYLGSASTPGDKWSVLSWVGAERAKLLHEIGLEARAQMMQASLGSGGNSAGLEDAIIELAYGQVKDGDTGQDVAKLAIQRMQERVQAIRKLIARIEAAPHTPIKSMKTAMPAAKKKPVAQKAPKKKPALAKKAAKKTPAKKKSAPAKSSGKLASKKKTVSKSKPSKKKGKKR